VYIRYLWSGSGLVRVLLEDISFVQNKPTMIKEDNQGAIALSNNPNYHPRTKHINIKHHFIRDKVAKNDVVLDYCPTEEMLADLLIRLEEMLADL
jgi:hypothetical protein